MYYANRITQIVLRKSYYANRITYYVNRKTSYVIRHRRHHCHQCYVARNHDQWFVAMLATLH